MIPPVAIEYFKRNREAQVAHVVLTFVFDNLPTATRYKNAVYAKKVVSVLRSECAEQLGEQVALPVDESTELNKDGRKQTIKKK